MNEQRIREIANQCSDFAEQIPYFRGIENGLTWEATIRKARDLKFAELIVRECAKFLEENSGYDDCDNAWFPEPEHLLRHFGVEE